MMLRMLAKDGYVVLKREAEYRWDDKLSFKWAWSLKTEDFL